MDGLTACPKAERAFRRRRSPSGGGPDARERIPTSRTSSSATACGSATRCTAAGRRRSCCPPRTRSCTPGSGRRRCRSSRGTSGWWSSTGGATGAATARPGRPRTPSRRTSPTWSPCSTPPAPTRRWSSGCPSGPVAASPSPPRTRTAWPGWSRWHRRRSSTTWFDLAVHPCRLPRLRRVLPLEGAHRPALHQAVRGRRRLEPGDHRGRHGRLLRGTSRPRTIDWARAMCARSGAQVLIVHGTDDLLRPLEVAGRWPNGRRHAGPLPGFGHVPTLAPVPFNLLVRDFARSGVAAAGPRASGPGPVPAPAGAVPLLPDRARSCPARRRHRRRASRAAPRRRVEWLAQDPVTRCSSPRASTCTRRPLPGQRVRALRGRGGEHDLHAFHACEHGRDPRRELPRARRPDRGERYDLVVGDEAWEVDHFLHENPELKRPPSLAHRLRRLLPMPEGGPTRGALPPTTTPRCWSTSRASRAWGTRSQFVGDPDDIVQPSSDRAALIRDWTREHFRFPRLRLRLRAARPRGKTGRLPLGWEDGRAGVRRDGEAGPASDEHAAPPPRSTRCRPRGDPRHRRAPRGDRGDRAAHRSALAAAEKEASRSTGSCLRSDGTWWLRPDLAARARRAHDVHGAHRQPGAVPLLPDRKPLRAAGARSSIAFDRYRAGRRMDWAALDPDALADAITTEIGREVDHLPVDPGGATRAAAHLGEMI